jgi:peptidylprolyl isomerase
MQTEQGRVIFELAEQFSPLNVARIKALVRAGFYDGLTFYRVIDGFVIQGGDGDETSKSPFKSIGVKAEFERTINPKSQFILVQSPDLLAEQTGFIDGFAVGRSIKEKKEWLLTCPGVVNLARTSDPNSATTDFAIMIGQAPRHLDRNMSIFGRIIDGREHLNQIKRGVRSKGGMIDEPKKRSKIISMTIAADLPVKERLNIQIQNTNHSDFSQMLDARRARANNFYSHKGNGALDICYLNVKTKLN